MLVQDLIKASYRKLAVYASGETPSADELNDGLSALQSMLRRWAAKKVLVYATVKESFTLVAGTYLYTYGTGGTFNSDRPFKIEGVYIQDAGGVSHEVDLIDESKYRALAVKTTLSRPYALFFHPNYPLANIYLYPVPDTAESIYFDVLKPFTEASSFTALSDTLQFPPNYEEALIYNLALRMSSEFGKVITAEVAGIAMDSYKEIIHVNSENQYESIELGIPVGSGIGKRYSINSDSYR